MSVIMVKIQSRVITASTATLLYTAPSSGTNPYSLLSQLYVTNTGGGTVQWTIWRLPFGGTPPVLVTDQPASLVVYQNSLTAGEHQSFDEKMAFTGGDMLYIFVNGSGVTAGGSVAESS